MRKFNVEIVMSIVFAIGMITISLVAEHSIARQDIICQEGGC